MRRRVRSRRQKKTFSKGGWRFLIFSAIFLFVVSFAFVYFRLGHKKSPNIKQQLAKAEPTPTPTPIPEKTFLLMGYGGGGHDGGKLTDTMIEAYVEPEKKRVTLISIPRDLWVKIPNTQSSAKINYAYASQGLDGAKKAVGQVTGIVPDYAAAVDFAGFVKLLKKFEPLKVDVPYTYTDHFYPIEGKEDDTCGFPPEKVQALTDQYSGFKLETQFPCRYKTIHFEKGLTEMTAEEALKFVRSRHGDDGKGDFGRSQRQQALIMAVKDKLLSPTMWLKLPGLVNDATKLIDTDISPQEIVSYIKLLGSPDNLKDWQFKTIVLDDTNVLANGRATNGAYILKPRENPLAVNQLREYIGATAAASLKQPDNNDPFRVVKQFIHLNLISFDITPTALPTATASAEPPTQE